MDQSYGHLKMDSQKVWEKLQCWDKSDCYPLWMAIILTPEVGLTWILYLWQEHFQALVISTETGQKSLSSQSYKGIKYWHKIILWATFYETIIILQLERFATSVHLVAHCQFAYRLELQHKESKFASRQGWAASSLMSVASPAVSIICWNVGETSILLIMQ